MIKSELATVAVDFGTIKSNVRTECITKITPHHMAGNMCADDCARMHRDGNVHSSANYYIGSDGTICAGVSEDRRAWTSSSPWNDQRAITIEVANNSSGPKWTISDKAYEALVNLCADICKRYNIQPKYDGTSNGSITYHSMFASTSCPGPYLRELINSRKFENDIMDVIQGSSKIEPVTDTNVLYRVQTGAFSGLANATAYMERVKSAGFDTYMVKADNLYKVQCGAFSKKENAEALAKQLNQFNFDTFITTKSGEAVKYSTAKRAPIEVAKEIIAGKGNWGTGSERKRKLTEAGYDYTTVQTLINQLLRKG